MIRRVLLYLALGIWLLLMTALAALWIRSYYRADILARFSNNGHPQWIASHRGQIVIFTSSVTPGRHPREGWFREEGSTSAFASVRRKLTSDPTKTGTAFGFALTNGSGTTLGFSSGSYTVLAIPDWAVIGGMALFLIRPLVRGVRSNTRKRSGLCPRCGYDLRATPGRCPECGAPSTSTQCA